MNLLVGALTMGLVLAPLTLGVLLCYRVLETLDLTADGAFGVGAALTASLLIRHVPPLPATLLGAAAGMLSGALTALLHRRFQVSALLAGVLVSTALYSVSLALMGSGNLSLLPADTLLRQAERLAGLPARLTVFGTAVPGGSLTALLLAGFFAGVPALGLTAFLRTELGLALRAAGHNPAMARAMGIDVDRMVLLGFGLGNGLVALSGALFAQVQGFASIQMGVGALVAGVATLLLGEALLGRRTPRRSAMGAVLGAVLFHLLAAGAIRAGLPPTLLKLLTALCVLSVLLFPALTRRPRLLAGHASSHA